MATASDKVDAPALDLDADKRSEHDLGAHSSDQETATDQRVSRPESGTADPNKTGVY